MRSAADEHLGGLRKCVFKFPNVGIISCYQFLKAFWSENVVCVMGKTCYTAWNVAQCLFNSPRMLGKNECGVLASLYVSKSSLFTVLFKPSMPFLFFFFWIY